MHSRPKIGEKHRRAVRGQDPEQQPRPVRDHRVGVGALVVRIGADDMDGDPRVDLVQCHELRARLHRVDRAAPVLADRLAVVARAEPDIEPGAYAGGDAASPAEKAVRHARQHGRGDHLDAHISSTSLRRITWSSSAWLPTMKA
jgi:hypothetical protein